MILGPNPAVGGTAEQRGTISNGVKSLMSRKEMKRNFTSELLQQKEDRYDEEISYIAMAISPLRSNLCPFLGHGSVHLCGL
jgi:hypothetical protein